MVHLKPRLRRDTRARWRPPDDYGRERPLASGSADSRESDRWSFPLEHL